MCKNNQRIANCEIPRLTSNISKGLPFSKATQKKNGNKNEQDGPYKFIKRFFFPSNLHPTTFSFEKTRWSGKRCTEISILAVEMIAKEHDRIIGYLASLHFEFFISVLKNNFSKTKINPWLSVDSNIFFWAHLFRDHLSFFYIPSLPTVKRPSHRSKRFTWKCYRHG